MYILLRLEKKILLQIMYRIYIIYTIIFSFEITHKTALLIIFKIVLLQLLRLLSLYPILFSTYANKVDFECFKLTKTKYIC